ncbi:MAG: GNAT family N-acetyltransferase [Chitinophagaceae bacterium]|nr:GNAT family N-acetyltransferase [Chitinophagaceae bacterium]
MSLTIKTCTTGDINDLIQIAQQSYREHYTYLWLDNGEGYIQSNFNFDKFQGELSDPNAAFFLIHDGPAPVGLIKLNLNSATGVFSADTTLELERIYFIKEASGKGLGKEAINFVLNFAKQRGKSIIWLKAMDSSAAVEFYKKRGFQITAETELNYPNLRDEFRKMYVMVLHLYVPSPL